MIRRTLLPLFCLFFVACAPVIKPVAVSPTDTAQATGVPTKAQVTPTPAPLDARVKADSLHVRTAPMGLRVGYLYSGDVVTLTNKCSDNPKGWAEIVWQGRAAWVNAKYLSDNKCKEGE